MDSPGRTHNMYSGGNLCLMPMGRKRIYQFSCPPKASMMGQLSSTKDSYSLIVEGRLSKRGFGHDIIFRSVLLTSTTTVVPLPICDFTENLPLSKRARSCIPIRPNLPLIAKSPSISGSSKPMPLSDTTSLTLLRVNLSLITAFVAPECFLTLRSAS